ncbi:hypothetical protein AB0G04_42260 [Actinoplanes sp. NPDC023801]|uniref:hypothetical protein n=1 Tax=Actinoplanes sp. NPDC023801 TaxID=3154595 RepID=UPI003405CEAD
MIPVWLLDVDGVVNAFRAGWYTRPRLVEVYSSADDYLYRIRYEPRVVDMIRRIHRTRWPRSPGAPHGAATRPRWRKV